MKYQGVIFDLDGVICHTDDYHYQAWKRLANKLGIYFDETINNRLRGISRMESLDIVLEKYHKTLTWEEKVKYAEEKNTFTFSSQVRVLWYRSEEHTSELQSL